MAISRNAAAALALALALGVPAAASAGTLLNQSITGLVTLSGADDNGGYSIDVFNGSIAVGAGFTTDIPIFKQLTNAGFHGPSNQITGDVQIDISGGAITVTLNGQAQPFQLTSTFSGIAGPITGVADSATGVLGGVNTDGGVTFDASSLSFSSTYFGYQPGTHLAQTEALSFGAGVDCGPSTRACEPGSGAPEPSAWALMLLGFGGAGAMLRRTRSPVAA
ncbi:MAG TPA: PEP-CTERM sorting domain-containing protein [Phenylobacterium sp.]